MDVIIDEDGFHAKQKCEARQRSYYRHHKIHRKNRRKSIRLAGEADRTENDGK